MSLRKTAVAAGISPTYLAQLERDESTPSEKVVFALAQALDCDGDDLLAVTGRIAEDVLGVIRSHPRSAAKLLLAVKNLTDDDIMKVARRLESRNTR